MLWGRDGERRALAALVDAARSGGSGVLVVRGEPGIGKTALLDQAARDAEGLRVLRAEGVEAEAGLPFAALQMLLRPVLSRMDRLPAPQAAALRGALGLADAEGADRFLVGLAVLSLLSELAAERPLLCLVDDAHWLDPASAETLLFAARRIGAEGVAVLFAARDGFAAPGLPELVLDGLDRHAATELLDARAPELGAPVRDRIVTEAGGNPLALTELPHGLTAEQRAGHAAPPGGLPVTRRLLEAFGARIDRLSERARLALTIAAAEGGGELGTVVQAGRAVGVTATDLEEAERAGLIRTTGVSVAFRHPLIRAAAYQGAPLTARLRAHRALADALHGDRRVLHRAAAAVAPDESVAAELERAAERAGARGALPAAVPLMEQAARLSPDPADRTRRLVRAAQTAVTGGRTEEAADLAERAWALAEDPPSRAGLAMVRATVEFERGVPHGTADLLADSAAPVADDDPGLALTLLVIAAGNAWSSGEPAALRRAARLAAPLRPVSPPLVDGIAALARVLDGDHAEGLPGLRALVDEARADPPESLIARLFVMAAAQLLGADDALAELAAADVARARGRGLAGALPLTLQLLGHAQLAAGLHRDAAATVAEALDLAHATGQAHRAGRVAAVIARLAAVEGDERRCRDQERHATTAESAAAVACALGLLDLAHRRHERASRRLEEATAGHTAAAVFALPDLVEAAVRAERPDRAAGPFARFTAWAGASGQPWAAAVAARCRALLHPAEEHYRDALRLHERGGRPFERARTELLYGEWLRRERRRTDAREPLRSALTRFEHLGAAPWADRARTELRATGEGTAPAAVPGPADRLTPRELQIVRLAAAGAGNREIAAQLFLSHRTVEYHLYKAYPKLGVSSRAELARLGLGG
ncbi:ATP-binding protein [Actinomadura kijaniata]|uniref:ATP-binding protein n=1 Tax=Actinomadura kijaniata TaxID=46161 RepID=UPI003F19B89F